MTRRGVLGLLGGAALCPICATGTRAEEALHWTYDGSAGPDHWGALSETYATCGVGQFQTPIDLSHAQAGRIDAWTVDYRAGPAKVLNNGHTIQVACAPGSAITLAGQRFELLQFHFHHPSEHRIDGQGFDLECHLVHKAPSGALAVLGVFMTPGRALPALEPLWSVMPDTAGVERAAAGTIDPAGLVPQGRGVFRYEGSLTTPPCSEGLVWTVFRDPVEVSAEQIAAFATLFPMNARPIQPLNGRTLVSAD
ncbi:carbonic anhydrase [Zavarzinia sp. CC-PAN008]|uniref:carbonic anhydrase n=1 Tax=Zavarzinia sp. CC-PAN008 TaxID=3243332 RepID=UPI003F745FFC